MEIGFYILLVLVAFLYSSVGHGGASGYLALMAIFSFAPETMRPTALILNVFVSLVAFIQYYRGGHFVWKLFWPFALASVPMAYFGGMITLDALLYKKILGVLLLLSVIRLVWVKMPSKDHLRKLNIPFALNIGGSIGLFSGMIGIGGGIILSPVILLMHWADMKQTAAISALFIFVNSIASLVGLFQKGIVFTDQMGLMLFLAFAGGLAGAYYGAVKLNSKVLRHVLAAVLVMASVKLFTL